MTSLALIQLICEQAVPNRLPALEIEQPGHIHGRNKKYEHGAYAAANITGSAAIYCGTPGGFLDGSTAPMPQQVLMAELAPRLDVELIVPSHGLFSGQDYFFTKAAMLLPSSAKNVFIYTRLNKDFSASSAQLGANTALKERAEETSHHPPIASLSLPPLRAPS